MKQTEEKAQTRPYRYVNVAMSDEIVARIRQQAARHRRSVAQEAGDILELGLRHYEEMAKSAAGN